MKVGDLVRVRWSGATSNRDLDSWDGIPCVIYSIDQGACKVYDPFDGSIRTMVVNRFRID